MTSSGASTAGASRAILLSAVRSLVAEARSERATMPAGSAERHFYLGVEAAADDILHPELTVSREQEWLERQPPAFRDGYLRTAHVLEHASTAAEPPLHIPLPKAGSPR
jgi:hypothetical protein